MSILYYEMNLDVVKDKGQRTMSLLYYESFTTSIYRSDPMEDEPRRSKRQRTSTSFGPDFLTYLLENEPWTFKEAVTSPEAPFWKEAINSEVESILSNHTWKLVDLPPGNKPLQCKWIFKRKMKANGAIDK